MNHIILHTKLTLQYLNEAYKTNHDQSKLAINVLEKRAEYIVSSSYTYIEYTGSPREQLDTILSTHKKDGRNGCN